MPEQTTSESVVRHSLDSRSLRDPEPEHTDVRCEGCEHTDLRRGVSASSMREPGERVPAESESSWLPDSLNLPGPRVT